MQPLLDHKERTDTQLIIEKHRFRPCSTSTDAAKLKEKTQLSVAAIHTSNGLQKKVFGTYKDHRLFLKRSE